MADCHPWVLLMWSLTYVSAKISRQLLHSLEPSKTPENLHPPGSDHDFWPRNWASGKKIFGRLTWSEEISRKSSCMHPFVKLHSTHLICLIVASCVIKSQGNPLLTRSQRRIPYPSLPINPSFLDLRLEAPRETLPHSETDSSRLDLCRGFRYWPLQKGPS